MINQRPRYRRLQQATELLDQAHRALHLGSGYVNAEAQIRRALGMLNKGGWLSPDTQDAAALEIAGEACLLLGMILRLRGQLTASSRWLDRASHLLERRLAVRIDGRSAVLLSETLNTASLVVLNGRIRDPMRISSGAVHEATQMQKSFVSQHLHFFDDALDHRLESINRCADEIGLTAPAHVLRSYLALNHFEAISNDRPAHNRALRNLYMAKVAGASGDLENARRFMLASMITPVAEHSNFIRIISLETTAFISRLEGNAEAEAASLRQAHVMRQIEQLSAP